MIRAILVLQALAMAAVLGAPFVERTWPPPPFPNAYVLDWCAFGCFAIGGLLAVGASLRMGRVLVLGPRPKEDGALVTAWPFSWMRNPIYTGVITVAVGWSLRTRSLLAGVFTALLTLIFVIKVRLEERFLREKFGPSYDEYARRVGRFLPRP